METLDTAHLRGELRKMLDRPQEIQTGYFGPGIWIRIGVRLAHWFIVRSTITTGDQPSKLSGLPRPWPISRRDLSL